MKEIEYRLVLVEWRDKYNDDVYYLPDLMKVPKFRTLKKAREWARKNLNKIIKSVVDENYTSDLYIEEWKGEWVTGDWFYANLFTKESNNE